MTWKELFIGHYTSQDETTKWKNDIEKAKYLYIISCVYIYGVTEKQIVFNYTIEILVQACKNSVLLSDNPNIFWPDVSLFCSYTYN